MVWSSKFDLDLAYAPTDVGIDTPSVIPADAALAQFSTGPIFTSSSFEPAPILGTFTIGSDSGSASASGTGSASASFSGFASGSGISSISISASAFVAPDGTSGSTVTASAKGDTIGGTGAAQAGNDVDNFVFGDVETTTPDIIGAFADLILDAPEPDLAAESDFELDLSSLMIDLSSFELDYGL